jgi:hypothetical protein
VVIRDNPICAASSNLVRSYLIASMPLLRFFNDEAVSPAERFAAERQFRPLLDTMASTRIQVTNEVNIQLQSSSLHATTTGAIALGDAAAVQDISSAEGEQQLATAAAAATSSTAATPRTAAASAQR